MSTQLESQRFFTAEFNPYATAETADALDPSLQPDRLPDLWTPSLTAICVFCTVFGAWGILGGLLSIVSLLWMESSMDMIETMQVSEQFKAAVEANVAWQPLAVACQCFRILLGLAFVGGAIMLQTKTDSANKSVALIFVAAIVYGMLTLAYAYLSSSAAVEVMQGEANAQGMVMVIAMVFAGGLFAVKLGIYGAMIAYLNSNKVRQMFASKEKKPDSIAPMEFVG